MHYIMQCIEVMMRYELEEEKSTVMSRTQTKKAEDRTESEEQTEQCSLPSTGQRTFCVGITCQ